MLRFLYAISIGLALFLNVQTLVAQNSIAGKIQSENNEALTGANIIVKNTTIGTASNTEGNYSIKGLKNGEYIIRVSFFGYETIEKQIVLTGQDITLNFEMVETSIDLDAVVITGTRTEKSLKNTPVLTQSISIQEIQNKDATNIIEALEFAVPGIEFNSQAQGKSISLQGIDPQYMLFLVDGERLSGDTYGDVDYSRINMADIDHVEVVKGASSTLYGSNALGGVVNIITKNPSKQFGMGASTRFSKYNTQNYQFSTGSNLGKVSSQLSAVYDKTDGYDLLKGNSYRTQEKEDAVVLSERLKYSPTNNLLFEANASFLNKNRDNSSADLYNRKNKDLTYGAKGTYFINPKNNITLSWNSDNYQMLDKVTPNELNSVYNNLNNTTRLMGDFNLANWNLLTVGSEYVSENLTAPRNGIEDKNNTDYIVFTQEDIQLGDKLDIIGGVRAINNSKYGLHFTPQMSAMYKIWHFALRGNYSMGYKTPSLKEKYMYFPIPAPGPPMYVVGYEGLNPETSKYASLSAEYTRKGVSFSVSVYRNHIFDMIATDDDHPAFKPGGIMEFTYRNYDEVLLKGVDVLLKTKIVKNLYFNGTVTFSRKYDQKADKEFENVRNFTGKFNLDYKLKINNYGLNANLQSNYYGAKSLNLMDETTHQYQTIELESFSLWKVTTTHTFKSDYYIKLGVDNIFDFMDKTGGYNNGTPGRTLFFGIGLNI